MDHVYGVIGSILLSVFGAWLTNYLVLEFGPILIKANKYGVDQCKRKSCQRKIPEPMGAVTATTYLVVMFLFIPFPFYGVLVDSDPAFPHQRFVEFIAGLLSICCMIFLGFLDDVLDLRWRHKIFIPGLAALPLLMVYAANWNSTTIAMPAPFVYITGVDSLNIGFFYYAFMIVLSIFCTHAVNILAGINGLEVGQSLVIAVSIILFNVIQIIRRESQLWYHLFSIYFILPYIAVSGVLLRYNWYPAQVFVGDTFCYFSGMTFAVVAILGHFSKTLLLFFVPQILNFLYSCPQLFRLVPCPRHRLPKYIEADDNVHMSMAQFAMNDLSFVGQRGVKIASGLGLLYLKELQPDSGLYECNNMTLLNLFLKLSGPMHESELCRRLLLFQVACSALAFFVRFFMAGLLYEHVH